jgi:hypothetical protein
MVSKNNKKKKYLKTLVCRYRYKPLKRIWMGRRCSECDLIVAVEDVERQGTEGEVGVDVTINVQSYEEYLVMERFNNWMEQEHSR